MQRSEFKTLDRYLLQLKDESKDTKSKSEYKTKEFYSLVPLLLQKYPDILVRDFLDTDGTFAVAFPKDKDFKLLDALNVYLDVAQIVADTTYLNVRNTGFLELEANLMAVGECDIQGFWILLA